MDKDSKIWLMALITLIVFVFLIYVVYGVVATINDAPKTKSMEKRK